MTSRPKVLVTHAIPPSVLATLEGKAEVILGPTGGELMSRSEVLNFAPEVVAIINQAELRVDSELLDFAPNLKVVANISLGTDNLDLSAMSARGVWATNSPGTFVNPTADCTMALLLAVARRIPEADAYVRSGDWKSFQPGRWDGMELSGKTLGIVGFGSIGQAVAKRAEAFGMEVVFFSRGRKMDQRYRELDPLLEEADIVSLHIPLLRETHHLMNAARFSRMKRGSIFLNMARGKTMDEEALVANLLNGNISGAGLDVFENEPSVHPKLLRLKNVVLTPHLGGSTREARTAGRLHACKEVASVLSGFAPSTPVNQLTSR